MSLGFFKVGQTDKNFKSDIANTITNLGIETNPTDPYDIYKKNIGSACEVSFNKGLESGKENLNKQVDWITINNAVIDGTAKTKYPVGMLLKDNDIFWRVNHYRTVELEDGSTANGMFLETAYAQPFAFPYHFKTALMVFPDGLEPGDYYIYCNGATSSYRSYYTFTTTMAIPPDGMIYSNSNSNSTYGYYSIKELTTSDGVSDLETVTTTSVSTSTDASKVPGTSLGTVNYNSISETINSTQYAEFGSAIWSTSLARMYLNSDSTDWCKNIETFDMNTSDRFSSYNRDISGFLSYLSSSLRSVMIAPKNSVYRFKTTTFVEDTYDLVTIPAIEQMIYVDGLESLHHDVWNKNQDYICPIKNGVNVSPRYIRNDKLNLITACGLVSTQSISTSNLYACYKINNDGTMVSNNASTSNNFISPIICIGG